ncbi:MAG: hypothetical protein H7Y00_00345 [Fimbriimonadaceae bacterium]|nr:hypothetical protein [Chitinophagales bacterium]
MLYCKLFFTFVFLFCIAAFTSCTTDNSIKPSAYPRVHYPESNNLVTYNDASCPYTFQVPDYYVIQRKTKFFNEDVLGDCWLNLECSDLNATIYLSYKKLSPDQTLQKLVEEAYKLTFKHTQKADYIQPQEIDNGNGAVGLIYYVGGEAASNIQFFVTDTTENFIRGALYFYAHPNSDSLKPVVDFMIEDVKEILESWRWKNSYQI